MSNRFVSEEAWWRPRCPEFDNLRIKLTDIPTKDPERSVQLVPEDELVGTSVEHFVGWLSTQEDGEWAWLQENAPQHEFTKDGWVVFEQPNDALMFLLRWG